MYNPQQNGLAERKIGHIMETARAILLYHYVRKDYLGEAVLMAVHLINCLTTRTLCDKGSLMLLSSQYRYLGVLPMFT